MCVCVCVCVWWHCRYETLVKPYGELNGKPVAAKDVVELQKGGTGFAAHDKHAQSKKAFALGVGNGLADVRGQAGGAGSRAGLSFSN